MSKKINYESYIGQTINELTIVGINYEKKEEDILLGKKPRNYYNCICSCNKDKVIPMDANKIINNAVSHCRYCFPMNIRVDLTNKTFGRLTVIELARDLMNERKKDKKYGALWYCKCNCSNPNLIPVFKENLENGNTTSCGCVHKEVIHSARFIDLTGKRFERLEVLHFDYETYNKDVIRQIKHEIQDIPTHWMCKCDCGKELSIRAGNLSNGHTISCGCYRTELITDYNKNKALDGNSIAHYIENTYGENTLSEYWLFEENDKLGVNPYEINQHSDFKAWFKCFNEKEEHDKYLMTIKDFTRGHRCNICSMSSGELEIANYLELHNINFTPQKSYSDLIGLGGRLLRYDFYIHELNTFIEFHGKQHEIFVPHMHRTQETYLKQVEHDRLKVEYAKKHNINMIIIQYYDQPKIKEILDNIFEGSETLVS